MDSTTVIKILMAMIALLYLAGLTLVLICEWRKTSIYKQAKIQLEVVENLKMSRAVLHVKSFKIRQDYLRKMAEIDRRQRFILERLLLIKRSTLKTKCRNICPTILL